MKSIFVAVVLGVLPLSANALSCMQPSPKMSLSYGKEQNKVTAFVDAKVIGVLEDEQRAIDAWARYALSVEGRGQSLKKPYPGKFEVELAVVPIGVVGPEGVRAQLREIETVQVVQECIGPWCAGFPKELFELDGEFSAIITADLAENGAISRVWNLTPSACGGVIFRDVSLEEREKIRQEYGEK